MEKISQDEINAMYKELNGKLSEEEIQQCTDLYTKMFEIVLDFIGQNITVHKEVYEENDIYKEFIDNISKDEKIKKIIYLGELKKQISFTRNITTLGLFSLTKKAFGLGNKRMKKRYEDWLSKVEVLMWVYNVSVKYGIEFCAYLLVVLEVLKQSLTQLDEELDSL